MNLTPAQEKLLFDFEPGRRTELLTADRVPMRNLIKLGLTEDLGGEGRLTPEGEKVYAELLAMRHRALKRFTTEGITSKGHKNTLKKAEFIEYSHGFWHLSDKGKQKAEELGYL